MTQGNIELDICKGVYILYMNYILKTVLNWLFVTICIFLNLATVITNLLSAIPWIGKDIVEFIWGSFSVDNPTLNRFFSLHYLLPFVLAALVVMHLISLHEHGFKGLKFIRKLHFIIPNIRSNKRIGPHPSEVYEFLFGSGCYRWKINERRCKIPF